MMDPTVLRQFWSAMAGHLWATGLVILALAAIERTLLRGAPARYAAFLWSTCLFVLCLPAWLAAPFLRSLVGSWAPAGLAIDAGTPSVALRTVMQPALLHASSQSSLVWPWVGATALWLGGASLLAVWLRSRGRAATAVVTTVGPVMGKRLAVAASRGGVAADRVRVSATGCSPHARGFLRGQIIVPLVLLEELTPDELAAVIAHEAAHLRRRDPARALFYRAALLTFWFFPLTWLVLRRLYRATEMVCDEAVLRAGFDPSVYARAIARAVQLGTGWRPQTEATLVRGTGAEIGLRIEAIRRANKETSMRKITMAMGLAGTVLIATLVAAAPVGQAAPTGELRALLRQQGGDFEDLLGLRGVGREMALSVEDDLRNVLLRVARVGGFRITFEQFDAPTEGEPIIRIGMGNATVGEVLVHLARNYGLEYERTSRTDLVVRRTAPAGTVSLRRLQGPDQAAAGPRRVGGELRSPERVHFVEPRYPESARAAGLGGVVILEAVVGPEGDVTDVDVLRGLTPALNEAAAEAVRQWRYAPTVYEGRPVEVLLTVTVQFRID